MAKCDTLRVSLDEGLLMDILNYATRRSDLPLAEKILERIKSTGVTLQEQHYAPLIEIHATQKNISDALAVFRLMLENNIEPSSGSSEPLSRVLGASITSLDETFTLVEGLRDKGEAVHLVILNALVGAAKKHKDLHRGVAMYRAFPSFGAKPDAVTLNHLLYLCNGDKNEQLAIELWDDFIQAGVEPGERAYRRMIQVSLHQKNYEASFHWLEEMKSKNMGVHKKVYDAFLMRLAYARDQRLDTMMEEMQQKGYEIDGGVRRFIETRGQPDETPTKPHLLGHERRQRVKMVHDKRRAFVAESQTNSEIQDITPPELGQRQAAERTSA